MASVDFNERQLTIKLVYYGPPLSGKTTNLQWIHSHFDSVHRGRLMTLDTRDDRTLFFDLLPIFFQEAGLSFRLKVYTVPGQLMHEVTRRLVLSAVDGVAFVADSRRSQQEVNRTCYDSLHNHLRALDLGSVPVVVQYNKQDLPDVLDGSELPRFGRPPDEPVLLASAIQGAGVLETFFHLLGSTWRSIDAKMNIERSFGIQGSAFLAAVRRHIRLDGAAEAGPEADGPNGVEAGDAAAALAGSEGPGVNT